MYIKMKELINIFQENKKKLEVSSKNVEEGSL